ncbi:GNAT family N-acetyltransferase [Antarcticimicrobium luteum]|uniref:N-acetyltransferase n=1 Tax=Antarcticimicrobium luteum TaxID=2547397 RepID=A0A4R5V4W0_9RHOB|nr:GNAT family N-acetyltransferase [Antarcticimicrobium luteum]TDK46781.1 N-acetyltransferase [Antarcticimicrobium luteum]
MTGFTLPIPVIETERLVLRGPRESDFEAHAELMASERSKFIGGPQDKPIAWRGFTGSIGHWVLRGYGMWLVTDKADDRPLGRIGFINSYGWDEPELGWHLYAAAEGKGVAYEATLAARRYGAERLGLDGVISYIDPANARSLALATRLGARFEREGEVMGHPCHVYRHPTLAEAG